MTIRNRQPSRYDARRPLSIAAVVAAFLCLSLCPSPAPTAAQDFEKPQIVRDNAREILDAPEFRRLRRISDGPAGAGGGFGDQRFPGGGNGRDQGGGNGNGEGQGNNGRNGNRQNGGADGGNAPQGADGNQARQNGGGDGADLPEFGGGAGPGFGGPAFGAGASGVFQMLGWLVIAGMVALIVFMVIKAIADREQSLGSEIESHDEEEAGELEPAHPPGELPADVYVERARKLAEAGQYREAVAHLMLGAMSSVERQGLIRYRKGLTQRDYLRAVRGRSPLADCYRKMLKVYEPLGFGRRVAAAEHFHQTLTQYEAGFRGRAEVSPH